MSWLRVALRLTGFGLVTTLVYGLYLLLLIPAWPQRERLADATLHRWARLIAPVIGMRVACHGPLPTRPCLLVSNHVSYLDIIALAHSQPLRFVAKSEVRRWPLIGPLVTGLRTLYIDRGRRTAVADVNRHIARCLRAGQGVVVFPEGTSSAGDDVLPLHASLLAAAPSAGCDVHYAALSYQTPADGSDPRQTLCWWGDMPFFPHLIRALRIRSFTAVVQFGDQAVEPMQRKELARVLREKIRSLQALPTAAAVRDNRKTAGAIAGTLE